MTKGAGGRPSLATLGFLKPLALVAAVVVVYSLGGLGGPFLFDDLEAIVDNTALDGASLTELLWPPADTSISGRPVVSLSFAASKALSGLDPFAFRAFNLGLHALTTLLLFGLLRRTLRSNVLTEETNAAADGSAFFAALLWSVHPLLSETVLYVVQRSELWFGFFFVALLYALARAAEHARPWGVLAVLACALGCLSKEAMITAPIVALLYDRTFLAGTFGEAWRRRKGLHLALFGTWAIVLAILVAAPRAESVGFHADRGAAGGAVDYFLAQGEMLPRYLRLLVVPTPLVLDYGTLRPVNLDLSLAARLALIFGFFLATLTWLAKRPVLGFVCAAFFVVLAPTSSFVPILTEIGAERRMYVPAMALIALVVTAVSRAAGARSVALLVFIGLSFGTVLRTQEYASRVSIWTTVIERRPENARGHYNLGVALTDEARPLEAIAEYERAIALRPDYGGAHDNLGSTLAMLGRFDEALEHNREAVELMPDDARPLANLALTMFAAGRHPVALAAVERALALDAESVEAHHTRALVLKSLARLPEAEAELVETLRLDPDHAHAQYNLARMLIARGAPGSVEAAVRAAELMPTDVDAHVLAARQLLSVGNGNEALGHVAATFQLLRAAGRGAAVTGVANDLASAAEATGLAQIAARVRELARTGE
jgi:tetratricopeptide (TPR) repeat protein